MKNKLNINYDEFGDILEIRIGKPTSSYMKDLGKDVFERIDEKTGELKGFVIVNFKKRSKDPIEIPVSINMEAVV